jgi:hypothetical protein
MRFGIRFVVAAKAGNHDGQGLGRGKVGPGLRREDDE